MAMYQGRYSWDGRKTDEREPISWFPGAYDITIVNLAEEDNSISYMWPYVCVFTTTGSGYSVSANPERFAKRICEDFGLKIEKVLWAEQASAGKADFEIVTFHRRGQLGEQTFYSMKRRKPLANEVSFLRKHLSLTEELEERHWQ